MDLDLGLDVDLDLDLELGVGSWELGAGGTGSLELSYLDLGVELGEALGGDAEEPSRLTSVHSFLR